MLCKECSSCFGCLFTLIFAWVSTGCVYFEFLCVLATVPVCVCLFVNKVAKRWKSAAALSSSRGTTELSHPHWYVPITVQRTMNSVQSELVDRFKPLYTSVPIFACD